jgi:hypothetical protein
MIRAVLNAAVVLTNVAVGVHSDGWRCVQEEDE